MVRRYDDPDARGEGAQILELQQPLRERRTSRPLSSFSEERLRTRVRAIGAAVSTDPYEAHPYYMLYEATGAAPSEDSSRYDGPVGHFYSLDFTEPRGKAQRFGGKSVSRLEPFMASHLGDLLGEDRLVWLRAQARAGSEANLREEVIMDDELNPLVVACVGEEVFCWMRGSVQFGLDFGRDVRGWRESMKSYPVLDSWVERLMSEDETRLFRERSGYQEDTFPCRMVPGVAAAANDLQLSNNVGWRLWAAIMKKVVMKDRAVIDHVTNAPKWRGAQQSVVYGVLDDYPQLVGVFVSPVEVLGSSRRIVHSNPEAVEAIAEREVGRRGITPQLNYNLIPQAA